MRYLFISLEGVNDKLQFLTAVTSIFPTSVNFTYKE